jgi:hypothetical protein
VKFTTLIPIHLNDGTPVRHSLLMQMIDSLWRPFGGMTDEGLVMGHWIAEDGTEFTDQCIKISIECMRGRLEEAKRRVIRIGRRLRQRAMYFEVSGYDGVQLLAIH